jgi:hypothetical protein
MKRQRRGRGVRKAEVGSVTQLPENSLHRLPMRSPRRCLKTSAQTYREQDVRPRRCQVEEWPDHASVLLLVHVFTFLVRIKSYSRTHRRRHSLGVTSTNAIMYDHYLVTISCLVIEVLFAVTKKYLVIEDYSFYDDIQIWS